MPAIQIPADQVIAQLKRRIGEDAVQLALLSAQIELQQERIGELEALTTSTS